MPGAAIVALFGLMQPLDLLDPSLHCIFNCKNRTLSSSNPQPDCGELLKDEKMKTKAIMIDRATGHPVVVTLNHVLLFVFLNKFLPQCIVWHFFLCIF